MDREWAFQAGGRPCDMGQQKRLELPLSLAAGTKSMLGGRGRGLEGFDLYPLALGVEGSGMGHAPALMTLGESGYRVCSVSCHTGGNVAAFFLSSPCSPWSWAKRQVRSQRQWLASASYWGLAGADLAPPLLPVGPFNPVVLSRWGVALLLPLEGWRSLAPLGPEQIFVSE